MSSAGSEILALYAFVNGSAADVVQPPKTSRACPPPKQVWPRVMAWLLAATVLSAVSLLAGPVSAQSCIDLCEGECFWGGPKQECESCMNNCAGAPAPKPWSSTPPRQSQTRGASAEWVMHGAYCRAKVPESKWGYTANAYGAVPCCCFGGVDKPKTATSGGFASCVSCPEPPKSAGRPCLGGFESSGACSQCGSDKRANWASAGAGWAGVHEYNVYCCKGCKDAPQLEKTEVLPGFSQPFCKCPAP